MQEFFLHDPVRSSTLVTKSCSQKQSNTEIRERSRRVYIKDCDSILETGTEES